MHPVSKATETGHAEQDTRGWGRPPRREGGEEGLAVGGRVGAVSCAPFPGRARESFRAQFTIIVKFRRMRCRKIRQ